MHQRVELEEQDSDRESANHGHTGIDPTNRRMRNGRRVWPVASAVDHVEMLSGRRKKDYAAEQAANSLEAQAASFGEIPASEPIPASGGTYAVAPLADDEDETGELEEAADTEAA